MEIELNGRKIDLGKSLPLKIRDWKQLEKKSVTFEDLRKGRVVAIATVVYYILNKADSTVTQDEVDELELNHPVFAAILDQIQEESPDRPT